MSKRDIAQLWRAVARGRKANGDSEGAERAARTARWMEGRPSKRDLAS